jgi:hypothetical protein
MVIGGSRIGRHEPGISFGRANPVFLVPMDSASNVAFSGIIHGVRVIGRFAPDSYKLDTTYAENPVNGEMYMICNKIDYLEKQGEWDYFYDRTYCFHEYYDKGTIVQRDSTIYFRKAKRRITVADSMAKIRTLVDHYIKEGNGSEAAYARNLGGTQ